MEAQKGAKKGKIVGKIEIKNTKSLTFRPIFQLEHYKSINGQKK
jgi:hypothetical protein